MSTIKSVKPEIVESILNAFDPSLTPKARVAALRTKEIGAAYKSIVTSAWNEDGISIDRIVRAPAFKGKKMRFTPSHLRDYTGSFTNIAVATGLLGKDAFIDALYGRQYPYFDKTWMTGNAGFRDNFERASLSAPEFRGVSVDAITVLAAIVARIDPKNVPSNVTYPDYIESIRVKAKNHELDLAIDTVTAPSLHELGQQISNGLGRFNLALVAQSASKESAASFLATHVFNEILENGFIAAEGVRVTVDDLHGVAGVASINEIMALPEIEISRSASGAPASILVETEFKGESTEAEVKPVSNSVAESKVEVSGKLDLVPSYEIEVHDSYRVTYMPASKALEMKEIKLSGDKAHMLTPILDSLTVPVFDWNESNENVPELDTRYNFRAEAVIPALTAIALDRCAWFSGHTGTGKTTLIEQVCAILNYPFMRINFDSEISRLDLIGRDTLTTQDGQTVSHFVDGVLPKALSTPTILCCDEMDFIRPEIAYVFQPVLEGKPLIINEDGGRKVKRHTLNRIIATGNTTGQGDEHGLYQGARVQSSALLDRFTVWADIEYMSAPETTDLVKKHVPTLPGSYAYAIGTYAHEHRTAFVSGQILKPISPRGVIAIGETIAAYSGNGRYSAEMVEQALNSTVIMSATHDDRSVIREFVNRCFSGL